MYKGQVYFDNNGNHIRRPSYYWREDRTDRPNFIFKDKLQLLSTYLGGAEFISLNTGKQYTAFVSDLIKFAPTMENGIIAGFFTFRNCGGSTGIIPTGFEYEDHTIRKATD